MVSLAWHCAASASHISLVPGTGLAHGSTQAPWISGHAREGGHSAIKTGQVRAGLHDWTVVSYVSKVGLCGRRNTLRRFRKMSCSFRGRRFGRVHRHFAWQAQHLRRVVLRVFANRIVRAVSSGGKVQIPWQAWHFVRCAENWRKPRTKHRVWGSII